MHLEGRFYEDFEGQDFYLFGSCGGINLENIPSILAIRRGF